MTALGRTNRLPIARFADQGAYLRSGGIGDILLPRGEVPAGAEVGDWVEAFVFRDSEDRLTATLNVPRVEVGEAAHLEVVDVNEVGAFLDWGLSKDLLAPYAEQVEPMRVGERHVVTVYIDNSGRIAASARLDKHMPGTSRDYEVGDEVGLLIVRKTQLGWEVVVDDWVLGLLFFGDALPRVAAGVRIEGYIKEARPDGKLTVSLTSPKPAEPGDLEAAILEHLKAMGGTSPLHDKSAPGEIFDAFGVSKKKFKRAIGGLYRARRIALKPRGIELVDD
ncbi:MAG: S1-like domain-containing RNA-binding protein [Myxococcota bacterium]